MNKVNLCRGAGEQRKKIYALIPARKDSKRLPNKNIRPLAGKPLVEYAIDAALESEFITDIVVSTDDILVKRIAERHNIRTIDRKKELCIDTAKTQDVVNDFITFFPDYDCIVLLQPTSPLRTSKDIDKCGNIFINNNFDSVVSVTEIAPFTYYPNGAVYVFKNKIYTDNIGLFLMPKDRSVDIDTIFDFRLCEYVLGCEK